MLVKYMKESLQVLYITAASLGFVHTVFGPDHYLPFIVMGRAREWSLAKTLWITFLCGIGHILGSVLLGMMGIAFGIGVMRLEALEEIRGNLAAWVLIGFGLAYFVWGLRRAIRYRSHRHKHLHPPPQETPALAGEECGSSASAFAEWHSRSASADKSARCRLEDGGRMPRRSSKSEGGLHSGDDRHAHGHVHTGGHSHVHDKNGKNITPWILFTIFVLGPCEPLIPLLMYPASKSSMTGLVWVTAIFGVVTVLTMISIVLLMSLGVNLIPLGKLERYTHALAGATILLSGLAIQFLGL
ncbi:MAG: hypothetical protein ABID09_08215 [Candidatus Omnitrophota bacterium]